MTPTPPITPLPALDAKLADDGYAVLDSAALRQIGRIDTATCESWSAHWHALPPDTHLRDGGHYRRRRHGCFVVGPHGVSAVPHRAHWQPLAYNALHGGFERWFEPLPAALVADPGWPHLLQGLAGIADHLRGVQPWFVEAHPFRIDCTGGIGRPTPEGAHRDGVDLVVVILLTRHNIKGGETRVFDADGPRGQRFTLMEPWSALLLDDARVIHESTPIQPVLASEPAWRDTLVLTLRSSGFQGPGA
jgi:hypothetical protein